MPHFHSGQQTAWHSLSRSAVWLNAFSQQSLLTTGNQRTRKKVLQKYIWQSGIWMIWEDNQSSHLCITRDRCFCLYPALSPFYRLAPFLRWRGSTPVTDAHTGHRAPSKNCWPMLFIPAWHDCEDVRLDAGQVLLLQKQELPTYPSADLSRKHGGHRQPPGRLRKCATQTSDDQNHSG